MSLNSLIKSLQGVVFSEKANESIITLAEAELSLSFSNEYKEYLKEFGAASASNFEFTGLNVSPRINVVNVTKFAREHAEFPMGMYVVENVAIDGILILQNQEGAVFEWHPDASLRKIYDSLEAYLQKK